MNAQSVIGVALNAALCGAVRAEMPTLSLVLAACVACSALGLGLCALGSKKGGAYLIIAGAVPFVPLGLIAVLGARKVLDAMAVAEFEARRAGRE